MDGLSVLLLVSIVAVILGGVFLWRWGRKVSEQASGDLDIEEPKCSKCGAGLSYSHYTRDPSYRNLKIKIGRGGKVEKKEFEDYQPGVEIHQVTAICMRCGHVNEDYL